MSTRKTPKKTVEAPYADSTTGYLMALGERIGRVAHLLGGKRALARRLGVHESMLYRYIKGENALSAPLLLAIAEAGGVSLDWLAGGKATAPGVALREPIAGIYGAGNLAANYTPVSIHDQTTAPLAFDASWLAQMLGVRGDDLCLIDMRGDAMEPTLRAGDLLLVDRRVRQIDQDGLYALQVKAGVEIKRVQKQVAGNVQLSCDNPCFQSVRLTRAATRSLKLLGRVVWIGRRL